MENFTLPTQSVVYVMDAYCGWCWGFAERMAEFEAANRDRLAFTVLSGGLLVGDRVTNIGSLSFIPDANTRITQITGAEFGAPYRALVEDGSYVMNSLDAAAGLAALRAQAPERAVHWAHAVQSAFFMEGRNLSDPATIANIATAHGLDAKRVLQELGDGTAHAQAENDFAIAHQVLQVNSYPTLLYINGNQGYKLPATGTPLATLNQHLDQLLA